MTENQKLREALSELIEAYNRAGPELSRAERAVDRMRLIAAHEALALPTADHIPDAGEKVADHFPDATKMIETAAPDAQHRALKGTPCPTCSGRGDLGLPLEQTAAPDMPLSMNQFGRLVELTREHLTDNTFVYKATSKAGDTCHFGVESAAKAWAKGGTVEAIKVREFKLHTSSPTAAPGCEREVFEHDLSKSPFEFDMDRWPDNAPVDWPGSYKQYHVQCAWDAWKARAALSAGDAVDAQRYRWLMDNCTLGIKQNGVGWILNTSACVAPDCIKDVGAAIDAAMRKGQP